MGICITENYDSLPTGEILAMQTPTKSRLAIKPGNTGARSGFAWLCGNGIVMSGFTAGHPVHENPISEKNVQSVKKYFQPVKSKVFIGW